MNMTDFNDLARLQGQEAVKRAIAGAMPPTMHEGVPSTKDPAAIDSGVTAASIEKPRTAKADSSPAPDSTRIPNEDERPCFRVFDAWVEHGGTKYRPGVWYFGSDKDGGLTQIWLCSPLHIDAVTFDAQNNNFGRLLRIRSTLGHWREWAMPMELLAGDGAALRGELLAMGVEIDPSQKARNWLATYLQAKPPKRNVRCTLQIGWCGPNFVLPDKVIGPQAEQVIFQSGERGHDEHTTGGTLDEWRTQIAMRANGNPLLTLALSVAFSGPMLARCNAEGGGVHIFGDSSTGKTTALDAARSVWGGPSYGRSWRTTANGAEGVASQSNDCLLTMDDTSEADPKDVGAIIYALGNGRGKQRASRTGAARGIAKWRCAVFSSGERTIATTLREGGHRVLAGQSVRMLDIPAARTFGAWDELHGATSGAAFSDAIKRAAATHYGHSGRAFLERLTRDTRDFCAVLEEVKALPAFSQEGGEGQDKRAGARFALAGVSGELATEYELTGWAKGDAVKAAAEAFKAWRSARGRGNDERRQILDCVSTCIERHGDSRFSDADSTNLHPVRDRLGWYRDSAEGRIYLFTADGMREAVKGHDLKRALDALQECGALPAPGADGKRARFYRITERGNHGIKLYPINPEKIGAGEHGS